VGQPWSFTSCIGSLVGDGTTYPVAHSMKSIEYISVSPNQRTRIQNCYGDKVILTNPKWHMWGNCPTIHLTHPSLYFYFRYGRFEHGYFNRDWVILKHDQHGFDWMMIDKQGIDRRTLHYSQEEFYLELVW
jgi:hypothetical protein